MTLAELSGNVQDALSKLSKLPENKDVEIRTGKVGKEKTVNKGKLSFLKDSLRITTGENIAKYKYSSIISIGKTWIKVK